MVSLAMRDHVCLPAFMCCLVLLNGAQNPLEISQSSSTLACVTIVSHGSAVTLVTPVAKRLCDAHG